MFTLKWCRVAWYGIAGVVLAGCQTFAVPTVTPTRALTAPTLAPTSEIIPRPPSEVPSSFIDSAGSSDPTAAALPNNLDLPPLAVTEVGNPSGGVVVQITTDADVVLMGTLYASVSGRVPGVLLLAEDRTTWGSFPQQLADSGYTVLSVSTPPGITTVEFRQVLGSFIDLGQGDDARLDPGRIAVIGEGSGAVTALRGCVADLRCDMVGLLSPPPTDGFSLEVAQYGRRPLLVSASRVDSSLYASAEQAAAAGLGDVLLQPFDDAGQGAAMLANRPDFAELVITWLGTSLQAGG